ncbi:MAG: ATP-binding cassette domain-containing protein [Minisyncoccota bacterium]
MQDQVILRFNEVSFEYKYGNPILKEVSFSIRKHSKITIMGQNGSGKSTIFKLITGVLQPESGKISANPGVTIATAQQVIPRDEMGLTVREFFEKRFSKKIYDIDPRIDAVCEVVNLNAPHDRIVKSFSGGQQARLLLASALIQNPDILLLDEPTNNLDKVGIAHLTKFLMDYKKTCVVISHDADFLNAFTHGVLYLDIFTHKVEQYWGNYLDVVAEIAVRIERENVKNSRLAAVIQANKDKANFFAHKGGQMRLVARKMREKVEELEEQMVDVRKEDKPIRDFIIPTQPDLIGEVAHISSFDIFKDHKKSARKKVISIKKGEHWLVSGPNGIGKSTLLESLVLGKVKGNKIVPGIKVGYYRQDFSTLDFDETVYETLINALDKRDDDSVRSVAAGFLINGEMMKSKIGSLSEGQKGLVAFAQLVLQRPGLLILDEPTNHINFRHLPIIAGALNKFAGAMILVSHIPEFVKQIRIDETLDLEK